MSKRSRKSKTVVELNWPVEFQWPVKLHKSQGAQRQNGNTPKQPAQVQPSQPVTVAHPKHGEILLEAVRYGLIYGQAHMQAYAMFRRGSQVMLSESYIAQSGSMSVVFAHAARYIQAMCWTVDISIETSDSIMVRILSAWVEEDDSSGIVERSRMIAVTSPVFEPYARMLEKACLRVVSKGIPTIAIPAHMRP
jgi:hypothetical protein